MRKSLFIGLIIILHTLPLNAVHFWQPYPIVKAIGVNGLFSRLELSVFDSLLGTWNYYNTPYFFGSIDTSKSTVSIAAYTTYTTTLINRNKDYGFIIYDQELHSFAARILSNPDPISLGANLVAFENSVTVDWSCCQIPIGYSKYSEGYIYDINQHQWMGGLSENNLAPMNWGYVGIGVGGYSYKYSDDYTFNPSVAKCFYHPPTSGFPSLWHTEPMGFYGNQDLLMCQGGNFLANDEVTISIYDPWDGIWKWFKSYDCQFSGDESTFHLEIQGQNINILGAFDDSLHSWLVDTIDNSIDTVICQDRVIAYIESVNPTVIQLQTYSPNSHTWVKDSVITYNGINNLSITKSTVHWIDDAGIPDKRGYIDSVGWGNYDTPVQLFFKIINMYPSMGVPLIFARSCSYGIDSAHFYFDDGIYSEYNQCSVWHQYKINGSYNVTPFDSSEVCIETVTDSGLVKSCKKILFSTCSIGGAVTGSDSLICTQDTVTLILTGYSGNIQWQARNTTGGWTNITANGFDNDTLVIPLNTGSLFRAKVTNGICSPAFSTLHNIEVVPYQLQGNISGDSSFCRGAQVSFMVDSMKGYEKFIWNFPSGFLMNNDSASVITGIGEGASGLVSVYATTACGNTNSLSFPVHVDAPDTMVGYDVNANELYSYEVLADSFQWLLCPLMTPIPGATSDIYHPLVSGSYALKLSMDGCTDTSNCHDVLLTGIYELNELMVFTYPNPVTNLLTLHFLNTMPGNFTIKIIAVNGNEVLSEIVTTSQYHFTKTFNTSELSNGLYSIFFTQGTHTKTMKFLKINEN